MLWLLAAIALALVLGDLIHRYLNATQMTKRGKLQYAEKAAEDAVITGREPKVAGTKRNRHYVYVVTFSDGTWYQDVCSRRDPKQGRGVTYFDTEKAEDIEKSALEAHRIALEKKKGHQP